MFAVKWLALNLFGSELLDLLWQFGVPPFDETACLGQVSKMVCVE